MSISKTTNTYNRQNWERSDFPILCQTCLGENPCIRMIKENNGKNCKICDRPFTVFRWCPGKNMRYKKTEVCQACSRLKNVCQTCILDLEYNLPTQVRDLVLQLDVQLPQNYINQEYFLQTKDANMQNYTEFQSIPAIKGSKTKNEILSRISRKMPFYKRNLPHICSFWIKGDCRRGELCPYRHEKPNNDDKLWAQNIKDRYFGIHDPVAEELIKYIEDTNEVIIENNEFKTKPKHINYFDYYYQQN